MGDSPKPTVSNKSLSAQNSDVAVVGGGPAAFAAALFLAGRGYAVTTVGVTPRRRPGDTLPRNTEKLLRTLGLWDAFEKDFHAAWIRHVSSWGSTHIEYRDLIFQGQGSGWFIDRTKFDAMLRAKAYASGVDVQSNASVRHSEWSSRGWDIRIVEGGLVRSHTSRFLIDAAGRACRAGWVRPCPDRIETDHLVACIFTFAHQGAGSSTYSLVEAVPDGWFYSAALEDEAVVLFMTDPDLHSDMHTAASEQWSYAMHTRQRLRLPLDSARLSGVVAAGSSIRNCVATDCYAAAGDAGMTLDPLSSSGILTALWSGCEAAQLLIDLDCGDHESVELYRRRAINRYSRYLEQRRLYYRAEGRWPDRPFWSRRR